MTRATGRPSKYRGQPGLLGPREVQRLAWRREVNLAAREYGRASAHLYAVRKPPAMFKGDYLPALDRWSDADDALTAALAAPKPWTSGGQRVQPKRTTRRTRDRHPLRMFRNTAALAAGVETR